MKIFSYVDNLPYSVPEGSLSMVFIGDDFMGKLHGEFLNDPEPTDVITFRGDPMHAFAGEVYVSVDHARLRSKKLNIPFYKELALYCIHGWLHLAGLDDCTPEDFQLMKNTQEAVLEELIQKKLLGPDVFKIAHNA